MQTFSELSWESAMTLRILLAAGITQSFLMRLVAREGRIVSRFFAQYVITLLCAVALAAHEFRTLRFDGSFAVFVVLGAFVGLGSYCYWRAVAISQTRAALFTAGDDVLAMIISAIAFREAASMPIHVGAGVAMTVVACVLIAHYGWKHKRLVDDPERVPVRFFGYAGAYCALWAVSLVGQRYTSFAEYPFAGFLLANYIGTFIVASIFFVRERSNHTRPNHSVSVLGCILVGILALIVFACMALALYAYRAPQVVVQPNFMIWDIVLPAIAGVLLFKERLANREWAYFVLGVGGALLATSTF